MDILNRNTDYALRLMAMLVSSGNGEIVSARKLSKKTKVSYNLTCKLLQKLAGAKLVDAAMGRNGGFALKKKPSETSFGDIVEAIQGPVRLNRCFTGGFKCPLKSACPVHKKLAVLQDDIHNFLHSTNLDELKK